MLFRRALAWLLPNVPWRRMELEKWGPIFMLEIEMGRTNRLGIHTYYIHIPDIPSDGPKGPPGFGAVGSPTVPGAEVKKKRNL